jgi:hypothetical protein
MPYPLEFIATTGWEEFFNHAGLCKKALVSSSNPESLSLVQDSVPAELTFGTTAFVQLKCIGRGILVVRHGEGGWTLPGTKKLKSMSVIFLCIDCAPPCFFFCTGI